MITTEPAGYCAPLNSGYSMALVVCASLSSLLIAMIHGANWSDVI